MTDEETAEHLSREVNKKRKSEASSGNASKKNQPDKESPGHIPDMETSGHHPEHNPDMNNPEHADGEENIEPEPEKQAIDYILGYNEDSEYDTDTPEPPTALGNMVFEALTRQPELPPGPDMPWSEEKPNGKNWTMEDFDLGRGGRPGRGEAVQENFPGPGEELATEEIEIEYVNIVDVLNLTDNCMLQES